MDENYLKHIPTLVLGELPQPERDNYFNFLVENDIKFVEDEHGYYVAVIKVVNPHATGSHKKAPKSSVMDPTFTFKQRTGSSPRPKQRTRTPELPRASPTFASKPPQGITELLATEPSRGEPRKPAAKPPNHMKKLLGQSRFSALLGTLSARLQIRPKTLPIAALIRLTEEIYNARDKAEPFEDSFAEFVLQFLLEKHKKKPKADQALADLVQSMEAFEAESAEVTLFVKFVLGEYSVEQLVFFLQLRQTVQRVLKVYFAPRKF